MSWQPTSGPDTARQRAQLLDRLRRYFATHDVLAVDIPALVRYAASDSGIESFRVGAPDATNLFLHTSPESSMKRLLAAGYPDIYALCHVYRHGESGPLHMPEFTLAEWYRRDFDLPAIIADTVDLIATASERYALREDIMQFDYRDAYRRFASIDAMQSPISDLAAVANADADLRSTLADRREAWLDLILATVIAPQLPEDRLTVIKHYPASQAALARLCPGDNEVADRFEIFCGSIELANGYVELTDANEQRRRFAADRKRRERAGQRVTPPDEMLLQALDAGLPDCAGVALGVDRLHMVTDSAPDLASVSTFGRFR